ncbi:MAG: transketolase family protein [Candidatus Bathyarchaeia archaeon]
MINLSQIEHFGKILVELGREYLDLIVLDPDVGPSTKAVYFAENFPDRFINVGISEQDAIGIAAGLAASGKTPMVIGFSMFLIGRAWEQIANSVARPNLNVKIVATHSGLSPHADGGSHQMLWDIGLMRLLPNLKVIVPADAFEASKAARVMIEDAGPFYLRLGRTPTPVVYDEDCKFQLGCANILRDGSDATIVANGVMVSMALEAAKSLSLEGFDIRVLDMHTVKPLDVSSLEKAALETGVIVTAEEHSVIGGLGGAVSEVIADTNPVPVKRIGVSDLFGESSRSYPKLLEKFGLSTKSIMEAVKTVVEGRR